MDSYSFTTLRLFQRIKYFYDVYIAQRVLDVDNKKVRECYEVGGT